MTKRQLGMMIGRVAAVIMFGGIIVGMIIGSEDFAKYCFIGGMPILAVAAIIGAFE